jgi:uncharacterized phage-associated protein
MSGVYSPLVVSNNFIKMGRDGGASLSQMKLQKMLYFLYQDYIRMNGSPIFSERFEAWKYGPALRCVYEEFKEFGADLISRYYTDGDGKCCMVDGDVLLNESLRRVWGMYKNYDGVQLSQVTQVEGSAWYVAYMGNKGILDDRDIKNTN